MEKHYDVGIDIWSAGCIFAELLICLHAEKKLSSKEKILFPGKACYPLSPCGSENIENNSENDETNGD